MTEHPQTGLPPAAVILAGGRGERLGGVLKSELVVEGSRLLDRVAGRLTGCKPLLVSHGLHDPATLRLGGEMIAVPDLESGYAGPLAGLCGALEWLLGTETRAELLVSVAVDTPFLPADYVAGLMQSIGDGAAAMAAFDGQSYPTNAIWRIDRFRDLPGRVRRGTAPHSLKRLAAEAGGVVLDWAPRTCENPFANANTPEELAELRGGAQGPRGSST